MTTLSSRIKSQPLSALLRGTLLLLLLLAIPACSATPISIPGQPDGGVARPDFGSAADTSSPDGLTFPDSGSYTDAAPSPDLAAPDALASDGLVDGMTDGITDGITDGMVDGATDAIVDTLDEAGSPDAGAAGDAGPVGDAAGGE